MIKKLHYCLLIGFIFFSLSSFSVLAQSQEPHLEALYTEDGFARLEWAVEMLQEDVLIETGFEDQDTYKPSFHTRYPVFYSEGITYKVAKDNRYHEDTLTAEGWVNKEDFENGSYTEAVTSKLKLGDRYSKYYVMNNGTYRLEHTLYINGGQSFSTEDSYEGKKSFKIGKTTGKLGNNYYDFIQSAENSVAKFEHTKAIHNGTDLSLSFRAKADKAATITPQMYGGMASWTVPFHVRYGLKEPLTVTKEAKKGERKIYVSGLNQLNTTGTYYVANKQNKKDTADYQYKNVLEINKKEGYIILQGGIAEDFYEGYILHTHQNRNPVSFGSRELSSSDDWQLFNINAKVADYADYQTHIRGIGLWFITKSEGNTYIDDVKLGFATRAKLYKDGNLIYEGYLSDHNDWSAYDWMPPDKVENYVIDNREDISKIRWEEPIDKGPTHEYQVEAVANDGTTYGSKKVKIHAVRGIEGYAYKFSSNKKDEPNNEIGTNDKEVEIPINLSSKDYLHLKAIDKNGNVSETAHMPLTDLKEKVSVKAPKKADFGKIKLEKKPKIVFIEQLEELQYEYSYSGEEYRINIQADPLVAKDGYTLDNALLLNPIKDIVSTGDTLPSIEQTEIIYLNEIPQTILKSNKVDNAGHYIVHFPEKALGIEINPEKVFIDDEQEFYTSKITWELIQGH